MKRMRLAAYLVRYFGIGWVAYRIAFALARKSGLLALRERPLISSAARFSRVLKRAGFKTPVAYAGYRRQSGPRFFFKPSDRSSYCRLLRQWDREGSWPRSSIERIAEGRFRYFEHEEVKVGWPPDWHRDPFTGVRAPSDRHWSRIDEASLADVKGIWELSRFAFAYTLVRAYWRTGDERAADLFWRLVENWDEQNPTCLGVNWRCSQEAAIRVMAWCFALYGFADSAASSDERVATLGRLIWASGHRIANDLEDAISQRNNHGISAATGLVTIGLLFPEFPESRGWVANGRSVLERLGRELIYEDGAFAQHSFNYQRLMLHDYLWAVRLGQLHDVTFSDDLLRRLSRSSELLWQVQDELSGGVPSYGHVDGALILPLNNCGFLDYRPATQAFGYLMDGTRWWSGGAHDEDLLWLFGPAALDADLRSAKRSDVAANDGGYYTLRLPDTFAMIRCARFRHRPAQPDMLHVDVSWRGNNVAVDAGTFSYGARAGDTTSLAHTRVHNTVTVDGADQMEPFGKFLWFPWVNGRVLRNARAEGAIWEGEHDGYARLGIRHRRALMRVGSSAWLVVDRLEAARPQTYRLHWLMPDVPFQFDPTSLCVSLAVPAGSYTLQVVIVDRPAVAEVKRAADDGRGWRSRYYGSREPALSLSVSAVAPVLTFATLLGPSPAEIRVHRQALEATVAGGTFRLMLTEPLELHACA